MMSPKHRTLCTLMLLVVLASQALGGAHASSHVGAESGECALCATFANPLAALPDSEPLPLARANHNGPIDFLPIAESSSEVRCNHQRGPPARIC